MRYPNESQPIDRSGNISTGSPEPSGSVPLPLPSSQATFTSWQPTTWPAAPQTFDADFYNTVEIIFNETIIQEISNVINDIKASNNNSLEHRGHVVAIVLLCAIDAIASYAYSDITGNGATGQRYRNFIENHFPADYQSFASDIYQLYRNSTVHSWNLFEAIMWPGNQEIKKSNGTISFGLLNFFGALQSALTDFLDKLKTDTSLKANVLTRYNKLKATAK